MLAGKRLCRRAGEVQITAEDLEQVLGSSLLCHAEQYLSVMLQTVAAAFLAISLKEPGPELASQIICTLEKTQEIESLLKHGLLTWLVSLLQLTLNL